jgi:GxxExxY protein
MMNDIGQKEAHLHYEKETSEILNCAFEIINTLGHGLLEKPYENALCVEFTLRHMPWEQQPRYDVIYKQQKVGEYIPDLIVHNLFVVDTKVVDRITDHEIGQMLNYLKITGHPVGLIINFKRSRLEWKRIINQYLKS